MRGCVLIKFGEIVLKGRNRSLFYARLRRNVTRLLRDLGPLELRQRGGALAVLSPAPRTLDRLLAADVGPVELSAEPGVRRVIGVAGHYDAAKRGVAHLRAEDFDAFDAPGSLKAVVEFTLTPQDGGRTLLGCEVRVSATDEDMRSTLGMTWFAVRIGLGLAVRRLLAAIRAEAEGGLGAEPAQDSDTDGDHDDAGDLHPA